MRIGELAGRCGVNPKTLRSHEELGLLPRSPRTASGHRVHGEEDLRRFRLIRNLKTIALPLAGIRHLLAAVDD